jgi:hypothetical protein
MQQATMKLSPLALGITVGLIFGGGIFLVGVVALAAPGYGDALLSGLASIYPGYDNAGTLGDLLVGTLYFTVDGFFGGLVLAWVYNLVLGLVCRQPVAIQQPAAATEQPATTEQPDAKEQADATQQADAT